MIVLAPHLGHRSGSCRFVSRTASVIWWPLSQTIITSCQASGSPKKFGRLNIACSCFLGITSKMEVILYNRLELPNKLSAHITDLQFRRTLSKITTTGSAGLGIEPLRICRVDVHVSTSFGKSRNGSHEGFFTSKTLITINNYLIRRVLPLRYHSYLH